MGIQTTITLSRKEAEERLYRKLVNKLSSVKDMENNELEDELDEEFYNYLIK